MFLEVLGLVVAVSNVCGQDNFRAEINALKGNLAYTYGFQLQELST